MESNSIDISTVDIPLISYHFFGRVYHLHVVWTCLDSNPLTNKSHDDIEQNPYYLFHFNFKNSHFKYFILKANRLYYYEVPFCVDNTPVQGFVKKKNKLRI
jgi:hypothetical protein